ncbi:MAG: hypothetical protein ABJA76_10815 [Mucilaginibacter sp.]
MKKLTLIFLLTAAFFAGNAQGLSQHEPASEKLVLDNGAKWKVDKITSDNVANLQQTVKATNGKSVKSLKGYHMAGVALQNGITKMIRECRMKGPDHLALHKWLEPLMEKVSKLSRASDVTVAAQLLDAIKARLNLYNQYFQV